MKLSTPGLHFKRQMLKYRKIPIISPGRIFLQKAILLGLFSGEVIFGGACYRKDVCVRDLGGGGGLIFGRAYYRNFTAVISTGLNI